MKRQAAFILADLTRDYNISNNCIITFASHQVGIKYIYKKTDIPDMDLSSARPGGKAEGEP
jgi:hypothetical protein